MTAAPGGLLQNQDPTPRLSRQIEIHFGTRYRGIRPVDPKPYSTLPAGLEAGAILVISEVEVVGEVEVGEMIVGIEGGIAILISGIEEILLIEMIAVGSASVLTGATEIETASEVADPLRVRVRHSAGIFEIRETHEMALSAWMLIEQGVGRETARFQQGLLLPTRLSLTHPIAAIHHIVEAMVVAVVEAGETGTVVVVARSMMIEIDTVAHSGRVPKKAALGIGMTVNETTIDTWTLTCDPEILEMTATLGIAKRE